ncbi:MAG: ROK family protein [Leptonema sp. (in: Bacteria)]|nr:ROK family protein [Leptonema sp. (in: bacteria)]
MLKSFSIGIDLGGTKTEVILLDPNNKEVFRKRKPTLKLEGYDAICNTIVELIEEAKQIAKSQVSLGMGIPGIIDPISGKVINANTTILIGKTLRSDLEQRLNQPIAIENDANCFVMAEAFHGAATGQNCVFGVIMGTGCGGGLFINGHIYHGANGIAGEWGHVSIDPNGPKCWCGNYGCIETFISGTGLENHYQMKSGKPAKVPEILNLVQSKDSIALEVFDQFLENFGRSLGGLISVLDPDLIVIGGGLSHINQLYTEGVNRIHKYAFHPNLKTKVVKNQLGDSAGVFGAAYIGVLPES